jgi:uncharacterized protein
MKRKIIWFIIVFDFFLGIIFAAAWYFSSILLHPPTAKSFVCKPEIFINCENPKKEFGLEFEDVEFKTIDGLKISAWYIPSKTKSDKAVISVHGRVSNRTEGLRYLPTIHALGVNVLMIDLRNSGKSDKSFSSMSFHEKKDVLAGINFLKENKKNTSIGILGFSMGAATSIIVMAENPEIKVGVFDSGFADFDRVTAEGAKRFYSLPKYPLLPLVSLLYEIRGDLKTSEMSPEKYIGLISPRPVLILHGTADEIVFYSHGESLFAAAKEPKEFITVKDGKHIELWQADKRIEQKVKEYYSKYL